jgi:exosome complex exonuclease DIS3/RRP44
VVIDNWNIDSNFPDGHYDRTLGDIYDNDVESRVILLEHDIPHHTFSETVMHCLPQDNWHADPNVKGRRDLRAEYVMSVDPPGCTDIDDALHCKTLENGNIEIGVHIADVTHFVLEGSALDEEAAKRGTTVYLVDRRIEMLPSLLTSNLCSLISDVDRYAFSCVWEITQEGDIVDVQFCKSIIRSRHSLTYEMAQNIIDDKHRDDQAAKSLRELGRIAKILRKRRMEAGALNLASPSVKFGIDRETLNPTDVEMYQLRETNALVEEYMLLANISVAKRILSEFPTLSCLRRHPRPNPNKFDQLLKTLHTAQVNLDISSSKALNESLDRLQTGGDSYFDTLVRILVTRCMEQAVYFISGDVQQDDYMHYGLATSIYTHFTSPIRRYADVIVHRLLACALGIAPLSKRLTGRELARTIVDGLNKRNRMAQYAERASVELYTNVYFANRLVEDETAYITRVRSNGLMVFVPRYGFEHLIRVREELCSYDDAKEALSIGGKITLSTFQRVKVKIFVYRSKNYRRQLVIQITEPNIISALDTSELVPNMLNQVEDGQQGKNQPDAGIAMFEKSDGKEPNKKKRRTKK